MESKYKVEFQDLLDCGWRDALSGKEGQKIFLSQEFNQASAKAEQQGREVSARALKLFAATISMRLNPRSTNTPFSPMIVVPDGRRSALPEDFAESDIAALAGACKKLDEPFLTARFADIVWLSKKPREIEFARLACDSYLEIPLEPKTWQYGAVHCWARGISLCKQLGHNEQARLDRFASALLDKARVAAPEDGFYLVKISRLLRFVELSDKQSIEMAKLLRGFAELGLKRKEFRLARHYYEAAGDWYGISQDETQRIDCLCAIAETFVGEAEERLSGPAVSHMVAANFYEEAIQKYRVVSRAHRKERGIEERIAEIHRLMTLSNKASLDEMVTIRTEGVDVSEVVKEVQAMVSGKSLPAAVHALTVVYSSQSPQEYARRAEQSSRDNPLQAMIAGVHVAADGRVVAKNPGMSLDDRASPDAQIALRAAIVRHYDMDITFAVQAQIHPALEMLLAEHRILLEEMVQLASESPIVPPGREQLIGKALFFGFERDFETALHLCTPQIENLVRWHLKRHGVKTTTLNREGIEMENGLSTLADMPEISEVFGENLAFEFQALLCDPFGPNLRNEVAHGLLDSRALRSTSSCYVWWLLLKVVFNSFVAATIRQRDHEVGIVDSGPHASSAEKPL